MAVPHHRRQTAIAWARANVDKFGGDRNFVAVAGCSAGGHLAALAGLTANDPEMQGRACRWFGHIGGRGSGHLRSLRLGGPVDRGAGTIIDFLEQIVVRKKIAKHPEIFRKASPIAQVHADAPPFLVIHGTGDSVIPVAQAVASSSGSARRRTRW